MSKKDDYVKKMQAQLDDWSAKIEALKTKADKVRAEAKEDYAKQIEELRTRKKALNTKLAALKKSGDGAWEDLKEGLEQARDSLAAAIKTASSRFK